MVCAMVEPSVAGTELPPGYRTDLERSVLLSDGREVFIRPVRPDDAPALRRAIETADPDTLRTRFLGAPPHDEASIARLVTVDYDRRLALAAFAPDGIGVAIARYEGEAEGTTAEVAVAVDPHWRRVGLGSRLLNTLGHAAVDRGFRRFTALVQADNAPVLSVLKASGLEFGVEIADGASEIVMVLDEPATHEAG